MLKTLGHVLDIQLRVVKSILSKSPQTYLKDKSTKTALHEEVKVVKGSLYKEQHTLAEQSFE